MEKEIKCPECGSEEIRRAGKPRGKQQYQCKDCERKFITELNYSKEFKQKAIAIFYERNSGRAVGRIMGIKALLMLHTWLRFLQQVKIKRRGYVCSFSEFNFTEYSIAYTGI